jgi:hypothetical protein
LPVYPVPQPTGQEFRVNTTATGDQHGSWITPLAGGGFVVAWAGNEVPGSLQYDIFAQRYTDAGVAVGPEIQVNTNAAGFQHGPTVAGLADGGFVVSWLGPGTESPDIVAQRYSAAGAAVGKEFRVSTSDGFNDTPAMTALANGGFVVTWVGPGSNGSVEIRAQRFAADGAAAGGEFVVNSTLPGNQSAPRTTALADGGFVVTWSSPGENGPDIYAQRYDAAGAAFGEHRVNTSTAGDQLRPAVTALADGGFVVAWVGTPVAGADNYDVLAQRYSAAGAAVGGEFRVNTTARADLYGAVDVSDLSDGGFLVSWSGIGADAADVYAQRYLADGTAAGPEFRVNANTAGYEYAPTVVGLASGGFAVSWSDKTLGAGGEGDVYAQRFTFPPPVSGVNIVAAAPSAAEGNAGAATTFAFTVTLDTPVASAQSVQWQVAGAGASPAAAADFVGGALPGGTLTFAAGETSKTVTVSVAGDAALEWNEAFAVLLSNPSAGIGLAVPGAAVTILDDDATLVRGTEGDDFFAGTPGRFAYDGLQGHDRLQREDIGFRIADVAAQADGSVLLTHGPADAALARGVEELLFVDGRLVLNAYDPAAKVARLYEASLDRLPDQGGLNFWIGAVQNGEPLSSLASGFLASPEFVARFGGATADSGAFVDRLYLNVLGRAGEAEGRAFWVGTLNGGGATRADVLASFSESAENQAGTAALIQNGIWDRNEVSAEVARMYDTVFGRRADIAGLTFWKDALEDGAASREGMADAFTNSAEFLAQYGNLDNRGFANALYVNTLDRPADQAGLDFWTGALNAGESRSKVVLAFSESAEHVALTAPAIGGETPAEYGILFA